MFLKKIFYKYHKWHRGQPLFNSAPAKHKLLWTLPSISSLFFALQHCTHNIKLNKNFPGMDGQLCFP